VLVVVVVAGVLVVPEVFEVRVKWVGTGLCIGLDMGRMGVVVAELVWWSEE
jgi:hypothetical protein